MGDAAKTLPQVTTIHTTVKDAAFFISFTGTRDETLDWPTPERRPPANIYKERRSKIYTR